MRLFRGIWNQTPAVRAQSLQQSKVDRKKGTLDVHVIGSFADAIQCPLPHQSTSSIEKVHHEISILEKTYASIMVMKGRCAAETVQFSYDTARMKAKRATFLLTELYCVVAIMLFPF